MNNKECLQLHLGSCAGCNVLNLIADKIRWQLIPPNEAAKIIARSYCPGQVQPQVHLIQNNQASSGLGQRHEENFDFHPDDRNPKGRKVHGKY